MSVTSHPVHALFPYTPRPKLFVAFSFFRESSAEADRALKRADRACLPQRNRVPKGTQGVLIGDPWKCPQKQVTTVLRVGQPLICFCFCQSRVLAATDSPGRPEVCLQKLHHGTPKLEVLAQRKRALCYRKEGPAKLPLQDLSRCRPASGRGRICASGMHLSGQTERASCKSCRYWQRSLRRTAVECGSVNLPQSDRTFSATICK